MRGLYTIICLVLLQLLAIKPLKADTDLNLAKNELLTFYTDGLDSIAKDYCRNVKRLSEKILTDKLILQETSPLMHGFKQNVTDFLHNFNFYKRYGLFNQMLNIFMKIIKDYYPKPGENREKEYISKLLIKHDYASIIEKYQQKYEKFVLQKFLKKLNTLRTQVPNNNLRLRKRLFKLYNKFKKCENYTCYNKFFKLLVRFFKTPKEKFFDNINIPLKRIQIMYAIRANDIAKLVLKDPKLVQLPSELKTNLTQDLNYYNQQFESNADINKLYFVIMTFHKNITLKYLNNTNLTAPTQQLLKEIFHRHGYDELQLYHQILINQFVQRDLPEIFRRFKVSLTTNKLANEQQLLLWYDDIKDLKTYEERIKAIDKLFILKKFNKI